jgi:cytochrome c-type biogenesis protein CcmF
MVLERKKSLKLWTIALALGSFVLTIIGTFMTRSGVFNSVHSFTQSDIGPTFLVFIAVVLVFSVALLAVRGHLLVAETHLSTVVSREGSILLNNLVFAALTFVVLLGTVYPLATEAFFAKKITVGEPYFNQMALPLGLGMLFLMGVGPVLPWGTANAELLRKQLLVPGLAGIITAGACFALGYRGFMPLSAFGLAAFATVVTVRELFLPAKQRMDEQKEALLTALFRSVGRARRRFGGYVVHLAIIAAAVGIAASSAYKTHATGTLRAGETMTVGDWTLRFDGLTRGKEPHREYVAANITLTGPSGVEVHRHDTQAPRLNYYKRSNDPIGSPSVHAMFLRDVYVSLLNFDSKAGTASFNAWVFPLVGWIWYVTIPILVLGTAIALWPQRRPSTVAAATPAPAVTGGTPP